MFVNLMAVLLSGLSLGGAHHHQQVQGPCFPEPHVCGYPDPSNTGVPAGTELKESGDVTLHDGDTLSDANVVGAVFVDGSGVTIEDSKIHATGSGSGSTGVVIEDGASDLTILESEV